MRNNAIILQKVEETKQKIDQIAKNLADSEANKVLKYKEKIDTITNKIISASTSHELLAAKAELQQLTTFPLTLRMSIPAQAKNELRACLTELHSSAHQPFPGLPGTPPPKPQDTVQPAQSTGNATLSEKPECSMKASCN